MIYRYGFSDWDGTITTASHVAAVKKLREKTSPGPSGITPAHYKASLSRPSLVTLDAAMRNFCSTSGYSLDRHRRATVCILEKKPGNRHVEDSRFIVCSEIDWNLNNKELGRQLKRSAVARDKGIALEQYGSQSGKSAAEQALNHRLSFDLLHQERRAATDVAVDLVSCYDNVTSNTATLACRSRGAPAAPLQCMFTTLQNMVYNVRTAYGDSDQTVGGPLYAIPFAHPPQTLGQGNGAAPDIWAVVSTPVLEMLREAGHGAQFKLVLSGNEVKLVGFAFVDDFNSLNTAADVCDAGFELLERTQGAMDTYVDASAALGSGVQPTKCWWWLIKFRWEDGELRRCRRHCW